MRRRKIGGQKPTKIEKIDSRLQVPIVSDGAMAGPVAEGSLIPVLILDTTRREDVEELIRVHKFLPPGDVVSHWALMDKTPDTVGLILDFVRPVQTRAVLVFSIRKQAILVEAALTARAIYLQAGKANDKFSKNLDRPRILVEVSSETFRPVWDEVFLRRMTSIIRERSALPRQAAEQTASEVIAQLRAFTSFRMPR